MTRKVALVSLAREAAAELDLSRVFMRLTRCRVCIRWDRLYIFEGLVSNKILEASNSKLNRIFDFNVGSEPQWSPVSHASPTAIKT